MRDLFEIGRLLGGVEQRVSALEAWVSLVKRVGLVILIWIVGIALNLPTDFLSEILNAFK